MKFKVGDKVVPVEDLSHYGFPEGEVAEVVNVYAHDTTRIRNKNGHEETFFNNRLKLAEPKKSKKQRITELESQIAIIPSLVERIESLEFVLAEKSKLTSTDVIRDWDSVMATVKPSTDENIEFEGNQYRKVDREAREGDVAIVRKMNGRSPGVIKLNEPYKVFAGKGKTWLKRVEFADVYIDYYGRTTETVDVYELIKQELTPNQQRAEIIEKAMKFVEETQENQLSTSVRSGGNDLYNNWCTKTQFVSDVENRTVVALIRYESEAHYGPVKSKGIAKCHPNDVFNEHIGKAIALGRALGLDVNEFEQAVQPSNYAVGQIGINSLGTTYPFEVIKIGEGEVFKKHFEPYTNSIGDTTRPLNFEDENYKALKIINDTNAQYGGVE